QRERLIGEQCQRDSRIRSDPVKCFVIQPYGHGSSGKSLDMERVTSLSGSGGKLEPSISEISRCRPGTAFPGSAGETKPRLVSMVEWWVEVGFPETFSRALLC